MRARGGYRVLVVAQDFRVMQEIRAALPSCSLSFETDPSVTLERALRDRPDMVVLNYASFTRGATKLISELRKADDRLSIAAVFPYVETKHKRSLKLRDMLGALGANWQISRPELHLIATVVAQEIGGKSEVQNGS